MFKSPLTGTIGAANAGGAWAPQLKRAGYDMLVIHGRSESPACIFINDDEVTFHCAEKLWGKHRSYRGGHERRPESKAELPVSGLAAKACPIRCSWWE